MSEWTDGLLDGWMGEEMDGGMGRMMDMVELMGGQMHNQ